MEKPSETNADLLAENERLRAELASLRSSGCRFFEAGKKRLEDLENSCAIVNSVQDAVYTIDTNGVILSLNPAFETITGLRRDEWVGKTFGPLVHPDDFSLVAEQFAQAAAGLPASMYEARFVTQSGEYKIGQFATTPYMQNGEVIAVVGIARDITEHKLAEESLKESEKLLLEYINTLPGLFYVFDEKRFIRWNRLFSEITGYSDEELANMDGADFFEADDRELIGKRVLEVFQEGFSAVEAYLVTKHGQKIPYYCTGKRIEVKGKSYLIGLGIDISERKQAEKALRLSEATYREVFNSVNDTIWIHDFNTFEFIDVNDRVAEMFGYSAEEALGLTVDDISSGVAPYRPKTAIGFLKKAASGESLVFDWHTRHKDGHLFWTEVSLRRATLAGKRCILAVERDITERKQAEEEKLHLERQVQHAQKLESLGVLAGGIAHDFNNLLMGVLGNADMALIRLTPESPVRSYIEKIQNTSTRLADLTQQMLAYSGKSQIEAEILDLSRLVEEMAPLLRASASKKVVLKCETQEGLPPVRADASQLRQVFMNLIINAAESYREEGGIVSVNTRRIHLDRNALSDYLLAEELPGGDYILFEVSDTGCGMDKETCQKIFDPFFSTKFTGRGLGLAAVLGIIRSHCGAIQIDSEPNQGTTFKILLPSEKLECFVSQEAYPQERQSFRGQGTVLLVDDEEVVLDIGKIMLGQLGFTVICAVDGVEAVEQVRQNANKLVCVLLDLTMPNMDGIEAFAEIRNISSELPVIVCSGYDSKEFDNKFTGKGITHFLKKPFRFQSLVEKLQEIFQ